MKIYEILNEGRPGQQKVVKMYHGTSSIFLPSIQKFGLDPNPKHKSFGAGGLGDEWESWGGVYLTSTKMFAEEAAEYAVDIHGGEPIIITVQYVLGSGGLDEDHTNKIIFDNFFNSSNADEFTLKITNILKNKFKINYPKNNYKDFIDLYPIMQSRYTHWLDNSSWYVQWRKKNPNAKNPIVDPYDHLDLFLGYEPYRHRVEKIVDKTKVFPVIHDKPKHKDSVYVRITRPIKFKGKTRIVDISQIQS